VWSVVTGLVKSNKMRAEMSLWDLESRSLWALRSIQKAGCTQLGCELEMRK
jgi:hypothetical protein